MSKEKEMKIKEEELKQIQDNQNEMLRLINSVGALEAQKQDFLNKLPAVKDEMEKLKKDLETEYGSVSINMQDGSYEEIPKEEVAGPVKTD